MKKEQKEIRLAQVLKEITERNLKGAKNKIEIRNMENQLQNINELIKSLKNE